MDEEDSAREAVDKALESRRRFLGRVTIGTIALAAAIKLVEAPRAQAVSVLGSYTDFEQSLMFSRSAGNAWARTDHRACLQDSSGGVYVSAVKSPGYTIFIDGSTIKAVNALTGAVDYSGTDAATVIQAAIDALTSGGRIFIRAGSYSLGAGLVIAAENTEIFGEGKSTHMTLTATTHGIDLNGKAHCSVSDLWLTGTDTGLVDGVFIRGPESRYARVSRCWFDKFGAAGKGHGGVNVVADYALVNDNTIWDMNAHCISMGWVEQPQIIGNRCGDPILGSSKDAISNENKHCHNPIIAGNTIHSAERYGIEFDPGSMGGTVVGNTIENCSEACVAVKNGGGNGLTIIDNSFIQGNAHLYGVEVNNGDDIRVIGNRMIGGLAPDSIGVYVEDGNVVRIEGNRIKRFVTPIDVNNAAAVRPVIERNSWELCARDLSWAAAIDPQIAFNENRNGAWSSAWEMVSQTNRLLHWFWCDFLKATSC